MRVDNNIKVLLYGFLAWLIPFVISFLFYRNGQLSIDIFMFKSIMILVGAVVGAVLLILYFKDIHTDYLTQGIMVGLVWFVIMIALDLVILIPMSGMALSEYFSQIGIRYLVMPIMSITAGAVAEGR